MAILFDFNGTMLFDDYYQEMSWRKFVEEKVGRSISSEEFRKHIHGRSAEHIMVYFFRKSFSREEIEVWEEEKEKVYRNLCMSWDGFELAPGLIDFLNYLKKYNVQLNIATASNINNVEFFFEKLQLDHWFDIKKVVYNDGKCKGKPEPDMYLKAAENIDTSINQCFIFEDSKSGIEAAKRAGAKGVIQVLSPYKGEEDLDPRTDMVISDYCTLHYSCFL